MLIMQKSKDYFALEKGHWRSRNKKVILRGKVQSTSCFCTAPLPKELQSSEASCTISLLLFFFLLSYFM
jgi:hypothetical protein